MVSVRLCSQQIWVISWDQTYLFSGAGKNMWAKEDQFHFAWKKIKGEAFKSASMVISELKEGMMKTTSDSKDEW